MLIMRDRSGKRRRIEVADETLTYRNVLIDDLTPTGAQLAAAAGFKPKQHAVVLQVLANGGTASLRIFARARPWT